MKKFFVAVVAIALVGLFSAGARAEEEKVMFGFESNDQGWGVPEWALEQEDHVAKTVAPSKDVAKEGQQSLKVESDFPGKVWTSALVEIAEYFDWTPYKAISVDVYIPKDAPTGLKGKIILTVGENWKWIEMSRNIAIIPGEWVTISANLLPGSEDWRRTTVDDEFRKDIRKVAVRVESNKKPTYKGPIYIDNFRLTKI